VADYVKRFSSWYPYEHHVLGKIDGKFVPIPFNFTSIDMLFADQEASELKTVLINRFDANSRVSIFDLLKSDNPKVKQFGEFVFEKVFLHYTAKQWGVPVEQVDSSTINRVPVVIGYDSRYFQDSIQIMPKDGYTVLFTNMLNHANITIEFNTDAKKKLVFDFDKKRILFENKKFNGIIFFTGAIDEFFDYRFGPLPYRSLNLVFEDIDCEYYQSNSVVNYPNDELYTRITEFKYFTPFAHYKKTTILKEYPVPYNACLNEPYYPITNDINNTVYNKYLAKIAQFKKVYLCGRLAEYKYYNMDAVIVSALNSAKIVKTTLCSDTNFIKRLFLKYTVIRELFLYGIIGAFSAGLDSLVFWLLRNQDINLFLANFISINLGICSSFLLNTFFNFRMTNKLLIRAIKFFIVGYLGLLLSMLILHIGVDVWLFRDIAVKIVSVFIVALFQFILNKTMTFRKEKNENRN
jgi:UDP-galactopyranose mutase